MICLVFPSTSQLALIGYLQARAKLSAFEYENKKIEKGNSQLLKSHLTDTPT